MSDRIDAVIGVHQEALRLRSKRQELLAGNIANADTPGYKARDIDFRAALNQALSATNGSRVLVSTAPGHLPGGSGTADAPGVPVTYRAPIQPSADGNTVDMNTERAEFAQNAIRYEASVTFIGAQLRLLLNATQGQ